MEVLLNNEHDIVPPSAFVAGVGSVRGRAIDRLLREYFDGLRSQPIPAEIQVLIDRLDDDPPGEAPLAPDRPLRRDHAAC